MIIKCNSVDDFIKNLEGNKVWNSVIYYDRSSSFFSEVSNSVHYQLSCVIELDGGQALLECGVVCGRDLMTSDGHREGSERRKELHQRMQDYVNTYETRSDHEKQLRFLPGILDM